jgi:hypothetical protein
MTEETKKNIDSMSYESMLSLWRSAPSGHPYFQGEIGQYYKEVMFKKRDANPSGAVAASKSVGWDG